MLLMALGSSRPAHAQSSLQAQVGLWSLQAEGTLSVGTDGSAGTEIDVEDDLGYDSAEQVWQASAQIGVTHQLDLSYLSMEASADAVMARTIDFGEFSYSAESKVHSELQGDLLGIGYRYAGGLDAWKSGFLAGLQLASFEVEASASGVGKGRGDVAAIIPVVGVFAEWQPAVFLSLGGSLSGGAWDWQETSVTYLDAEVSARVLLFPFFAGLGYRHLAVQGDDTSLPMEVDLTFSGPTWFAGLMF